MNNLESDLLDFVPTKAALKKEMVSDFKTIVHESNKAKQLEEFDTNTNVQKSKQENPLNKFRERNKSDDDGVEFDMKKARHEVMKFGISGFKTKSKKKAEIALAIKLGAVPPKKTCKNYKDLLKEKKMSKIQKEENMKLRQLGKNQMGVATVKYKKPKLSKNRKKDIGEISKHYGVVNPKIVKKKK